MIKQENLYSPSACRRVGRAMFIVISNQLPTAALFQDITRAYAFRDMLVNYLRIDAEVIQTEGES